jgi:hypothetical protein
MARGPRNRDRGRPAVHIPKPGSADAWASDAVPSQFPNFAHKNVAPLLARLRAAGARPRPYLICYGTWNGTNRCHRNLGGNTRLMLAVPAGCSRLDAEGPNWRRAPATTDSFLEHAWPHCTDPDPSLEERVVQANVKNIAHQNLPWRRRPCPEIPMTRRTITFWARHLSNPASDPQRNNKHRSPVFSGLAGKASASRKVQETEKGVETSCPHSLAALSSGLA